MLLQIQVQLCWNWFIGKVSQVVEKLTGRQIGLGPMMSCVLDRACGLELFQRNGLPHRPRNTRAYASGGSSLQEPLRRLLLASSTLSDSHAGEENHPKTQRTCLPSCHSLTTSFQRPLLAQLLLYCLAKEKLNLGNSIGITIKSTKHTCQFQVYTKVIIYIYIYMYIYILFLHLYHVIGYCIILGQFPLLYSRFMLSILCIGVCIC